MWFSCFQNCLFYFYDAARLCFCGTQPVTCPLFNSQMTYKRIWRSGGMIPAGGNRRTQIRTSLNVTLSTKNLTWSDLGANPGLRCEMVTNHLSYVAAVACRLPYSLNLLHSSGYPEQIFIPRN